MAQKVLVELVDDLNGSTAVETVRFGLDGKDYEIDLSDENANNLRDNLAAFIAAGRMANGHTKPRKPKTATDKANTVAKPTRTDPEQTWAIREWAARHGHQVAARGRIPAEVVAAYHSVH